jgi:hypothetical protein
MKNLIILFTLIPSHSILGTNHIRLKFRDMYTLSFDFTSMNKLIFVVFRKFAF